MRYLLAVFLCCIVLFAAGQGVTNVTTAGTPVQLTTTSTRATVCTITAKSSNAGTIYLGFTSSVLASTKTGTPLTAGNSYTCMPPANAAFWTLNEIWLDATNSGDGVSWSYK